MLRIAIALCLCCLLACEADDACDPGQVESQGACLPASADGGGDGDGNGDDAPVTIGGGAGDGGAQDGGDCDEQVEDVIGGECTTSDDCSCGAPYCAQMPGSPTGMCTITDCTSGGDECPDGYRCFDLSAIGVSGYEPFCIPE